MVVLRKSPLLASVALCSALLLASCGDDDNAPTPTPTPTDSPTPSPTPTPTPTAVEFDFTKDFETTSTNTSYIYAYFTPTDGEETWSGSSIRSGVAAIDYDASPNSVTYRFPDSATVRSFVADDLIGSSTNRRSYRKGTEGLVLELPFEHILRVSYERVDPYTNDTVPGDLRSNRVGLFFNPVTTSDAIASNISFTGAAQVVGGKPGTTSPGVYSSPETTITIAASDKKVSGTIQIVQNSGGTTTVIATLPISATLTDAGIIKGEIKNNADGFNGAYIGTLAGPNREELFLIFEVRNSDGRVLTGSLIAG